MRGWRQGLWLQPASSTASTTTTIKRKEKQRARYNYSQSVVYLRPARVMRLPTQL